MTGWNANSLQGGGGALAEISVRNGVDEWAQLRNACGFNTTNTQLILGNGHTNSYANPYTSDGASVIDFQYLDSWPAPCPSALACEVSFLISGQAIEDEIRLSTSFYWWAGNGNAPTGYYDIYSVAAHEIGHALGLDHTNDITLPVMNDTSYPVGPGGDTSSCCVGRYLSGSDYRGFRAIYG